MSLLLVNVTPWLFRSHLWSERIDLIGLVSLTETDKQHYQNYPIECNLSLLELSLVWHELGKRRFEGYLLLGVFPQ